MIRYEDIQIGNYVEIDGVPRIVEAITKKKVGFHRSKDDKSMHYARLKDVNPLKIETIEFEPSAFLINGDIILPFNKIITNVAFTDDQFWIGNVFNESLRVDFDYVHKLQQAIKHIAPLRK